jgi:hypothetical protein
VSRPPGLRQRSTPRVHGSHGNHAGIRRGILRRRSFAGPVLQNIPRIAKCASDQDNSLLYPLACCTGRNPLIRRSVNLTFHKKDASTALRSDECELSALAGNPPSAIT